MFVSLLYILELLNLRYWLQVIATLVQFHKQSAPQNTFLLLFETQYSPRVKAWAFKALNWIFFQTTSVSRVGSIHLFLILSFISKDPCWFLPLCSRKMRKRKKRTDMIALFATLFGLWTLPLPIQANSYPGNNDKGTTDPCKQSLPTT